MLESLPIASYLLVIAGLSLAPLIRRLIRERPLPPSPALLHDDLERAEILVLQGDYQRAAQVLNSVGAQADQLAEPDGSLVRAWHRLACSELVARSGRREQVHALANEALAQLAGAPQGRLRSDLEVRARASLGFLATPEDRDSSLLDQGERALEKADEVARPDTILQLVWLACRRADLFRARGQWDRAKASLERAIGLAERLELPGLAAPASSWSRAAREQFFLHGRAAASAATLQLGEVSVSLGEREAAIRWLDRALALLEGACAGVAGLARARALMALAMHEHSEAGDIGPRVARLEQAVAAGLDAGLPAGRGMACEAEIALAMAYASVGAEDSAAARLSRIRDHLRDVPESASWPLAPRAALMLGAIRRRSGDHDGARAAWREALDLGRTALHPECRQWAAMAASHLHALLLDEKRVKEAAAILAILDGLVPTLDPEARSSHAVQAVRGHAHQALSEDRIVEARDLLARAEATARASGHAETAGLAHGIARDLGDVELAAGRPREAAEHFRRALAAPTGPDRPSDELAERAELHLKLAHAFATSDCEEACHAELKHAFRLGLQSGCAQGREVGAIAVMMEGDLCEGAPAERRELYRNAARLGRLSGRPRGADVVEAADLRLRQLAE